MGESRRQFLRKLGGGAAVGLAAISSSGHQTIIEEDTFREYMAETYPDRMDAVDALYEDDGLQLGIEIWSVGDTTIAPETRQAVNEAYAAHDVDLHWFERDVPQDQFFRDYSKHVSNVLTGHDSFYQEEVPDVAKRYLAQAIVIPTSNLVSDCDEADGGCTYAGFGGNHGIQHRFVVTEHNGPGVVMHENGHAHGLDHPDEPTGYIMTDDRERWDRLDYTPDNWDTVLDELETYPYNR